MQCQSAHVTYYVNSIDCRLDRSKIWKAKAATKEKTKRTPAKSRRKKPDGAKVSAHYQECYRS